MLVCPAAVAGTMLHRFLDRDDGRYLLPENGRENISGWRDVVEFDRTC